MVPPDIEGPLPPSSGNSHNAPTKPTLQQSHEGEHHGDYGSQDIPLLHATKVFALCAACNSCNLGFDIGVSTSVSQLIQQDFALTDVQRQMFVGSLNFFAIFGAFASNWFSDRYGRRQTFLVAAFGFIAGIIICVLSPNFSILILGRLLVGLGVGVGLAVRTVIAGRWTCFYVLLGQLFPCSFAVGIGTFLIFFCSFPCFLVLFPLAHLPLLLLPLDDYSLTARDATARSRLHFRNLSCQTSWIFGDMVRNCH